jgi:hypothetical protein
MLQLGEIRGPLAAGAVLALLMAALEPAKADDVPVLNVAQVCRGIAQQAAAPGERGGPDLSLEQCISSEREIRQRLVGQWSTFAPADRTECVGEATAGGESSYTDLLTCL